MSTSDTPRQPVATDIKFTASGAEVGSLHIGKRNSPRPTPETDADTRPYPLPEYAQRIRFEGNECVVVCPEEYEALYEKARKLERERDEARDWLVSYKESFAIATNEIAALRAEVNRYEAMEYPRLAYEVEQLRADKARLDWLDHRTTFVSLYHNPEGRPFVNFAGDTDERGLPRKHPNIRAAIDAAMQEGDIK